MYTHCLRCGRELKDEKAQEVGYGRVCKKKQEIADAEFLKKQITIDDLERNHVLKILPEYFEAVILGIKRFEIRKNDRDYKVGDGLTLCEYKNNEFTGRQIRAIVTYMTDYAQRKGYVVLGLEAER